MGLNVTFYLGKGLAGIDHREFDIRDLSQKPNNLAATIANIAGTTETATVELPENGIFQAELRDYCRGGIKLAPKILQFNTEITSITAFPTPTAGQLSVI